MKEKLPIFFAKLKANRLYLLLSFFLLSLLFLASLYLTAKPKTEIVIKLPSPTKAPQQQSSFPESTPTLRTPPKVFFEEYENKAGTPVLPDVVKSYSLKTNFSLSEALTFGKKLGLRDYKEDRDWVVLYNVTDKDKRGLLSFHKPTGSFTFQSWGIHKPQTTSDGVLSLPKDSSEVKETAERFLTKLGIADETVSCNITYQRKELPDVTYVECHRDWEKVGFQYLTL